MEEEEGEEEEEHEQHVRLLVPIVIEPLQREVGWISLVDSKRTVLVRPTVQ